MLCSQWEELNSSPLNLEQTSSSSFNIINFGMENFPVFEKCFYVAVGAGGFAVVIACVLTAAGKNSFGFCLEVLLTCST